MARARSGGSVKPKLNILAYGPTGAGKSTLLLQMGYFKRDDGTPFRILLIDCESGGADECLNELEENGVIDPKEPFFWKYLETPPKRQLKIDLGE
jgi:hypothetical protein